MPKLDTQTWTRHPGKPNRLTGINDGSYADIVLGDQAAVTQFGVRLERLEPGSRSAHRHWHETEDELIYVLDGALVLIEDSETLLNAGDAAGWAAGVPVGHCLENRSDRPATMLIVGTRAAKGVVHYPDHDVVMIHDANGRTFAREDGTPIEIGKKS